MEGRPQSFLVPTPEIMLKKGKEKGKEKDTLQFNTREMLSHNVTLKKLYCLTKF